LIHFLKKSKKDHFNAEIVGKNTKKDEKKNKNQTISALGFWPQCRICWTEKKKTRKKTVVWRLRF
jgi:hypothetical protein